MSSNTSLTTRSQEGNEQTTNPFDVIIKKSKFPGKFEDLNKNHLFFLFTIAIFGSKRPAKDKKLEKKQSTDSKSRKIPRIRRTRDETNVNNLQNTNSELIDFKSMPDNNGDSINISTNSRRNIC
jgi:hypothetical protein